MDIQRSEAAESNMKMNSTIHISNIVVHKLLQTIFGDGCSLCFACSCVTRYTALHGCIVEGILSIGPWILQSSVILRIDIYIVQLFYIRFISHKAICIFYIKHQSCARAYANLVNASYHEFVVKKTRKCSFDLNTQISTRHDGSVYLESEQLPI